MSDEFWCDYSGVIDPKFPEQKGYKKVYVPMSEGKRPNHVRCPKCRRRLVPQTVNAEPFGPFCPMYKIPKHKIPHGQRKKPVPVKKVRKSGKFR